MYKNASIIPNALTIIQFICILHTCRRDRDKYPTPNTHCVKNNSTSPQPSSNHLVKVYLNMLPSVNCKYNLEPFMQNNIPHKLCFTGNNTSKVLPVDLTF